MARRVYFECECSQSVGETRIEKRGASEELRVVRWQSSGKKYVVLEDGRYTVRIRATGSVVGTPFRLSVTDGGRMTPFEDEIRETPDGNGTGGRRLLTVMAKEEES